MKITVLALNGEFNIGLATVLDGFTIANELATMVQLDTVRFEVSVVGLRRGVRTVQGWSVPVTPARQADTPELVIVLAPGYKMPASLLPALAGPETSGAAQLSRTWTDALTL